MNIKEQIKNDIYDILKEYIEMEEIIIEKPKDRKMADYALPCFTFAKKMHKSPNDIALMIKENLKGYQTDAINGYLNIFVDKKKLSKMILETIVEQQENYGNNSFGEGKVVAVEYSSPNIAKPFGIGHLRSTVIGNALKNVCLKNGYKVYSINYLGDYGTQFGKLIYAYNHWGDEKALNDKPLDELKRIYVKFHEESSENPELDEEARRIFKQLEDGELEVTALWERFKDYSLKEFQKTYELLGISKFDSYDGESHYKDKMGAVVEELETKNLLEFDDGAQIVRLGDNMNPALIKRSDGGTLYLTRDIAAAIDRKQRFNFDESLYVVGNEQILHFQQLKMVLDKMGYEWGKNIHHISFGMMLQDGKKMSTRQGKTVKLHDVLVEAIDLAKNYIEEKSPNLDNKDEISRKIGVGAVIFNDLKNYRTNDIEFNLEDILKFEGNTGPYIQYTYARINSLLDHKKNININYDNLVVNEYMWNIIFKLYEFSDIIYKTKINFDPSELAKYLIDVAQDFNKLYANEKIVDGEENNSQFKLLICEATSIVIKEGMNTLGIDVLEQM
ncbi:MAG: arginine--tRNA ligase [Bacilli bacterium]|nr:arginine--tRNA ligase [Bacilli bacterium]MDD4808938.1 arginine--tRNA ligase [Bacilli bacterium]